MAATAPQIMYPDLRHGEGAANDKYADVLATPDPLYAVRGTET